MTLYHRCFFTFLKFHNWYQIAQSITYDNAYMKIMFFGNILTTIPFTANISLFKVGNRKSRKRCEIYSKLTIKTPKRRHWRRFGVFIVNFEHMSLLFLVFLLLTLNKEVLVGLFHQYQLHRISFKNFSLDCFASSKTFFSWFYYFDILHANKIMKKISGKYIRDI